MGLGRLSRRWLAFPASGFLWLGLGALLPDFVDKGIPFLPGIESTLVVGHSIGFSMAILSLGFLLHLGFNHRIGMPVGLVGLGSFTHLALDLPVLEVLAWPFLGVPASSASNLTVHGAIQTLMASPALLAGEAAGGLILLALTLEGRSERPLTKDPDPRSLEEWSTDNELSVAICTKGREEQVLRLLDALDDQTFPPDETIIVDGDPQAKLGKRLAGSDGVQYVHLPDDGGLTQARNEAIRRTSGTIVVFLDDDTVPEPALLEELVDAYRCNLEIGGAGGVPVEPAPPGFLRSTALRLFMRGPFENPASRHQRSPGAAPRTVRRFGGAIQSYHRDVLERYRFDENLRGYCPGEDKDFSYRVSEEFPLVLVPSARAYHEVTGWGSQDLVRKFEVKILSHTYHMLKNVKGSITGTLAYAWLMVGILCEAGLETFTHRSLQPVKGVKRGLEWVLGGMDGAAGVIDTDPRKVESSNEAGDFDRESPST